MYILDHLQRLNCVQRYSCQWRETEQAPERPVWIKMSSDVAKTNLTQCCLDFQRSFHTHTHMLKQSTPQMWYSQWDRKWVIIIFWLAHPEEIQLERSNLAACWATSQWQISLGRSTVKGGRRKAQASEFYKRRIEDAETIRHRAGYDWKPFSFFLQLINYYY